jgi:hypothetical protein
MCTQLQQCCVPADTLPMLLLLLLLQGCAT